MIPLTLPPRESPSAQSAGALDFDWRLPPQLPVPKTGARRAGVRYEAKVHALLVSVWPTAYIPSPVWNCVGARRAAAIPDGLLWLPPRLILIEVKISHRIEAAQQLFRYAPLVRQSFHRDPLLVEICRSYDPAAYFPSHQVQLADDLVAGLECAAGSQPAEGGGASTVWVLEWKA